MIDYHKGKLFISLEYNAPAPTLWQIITDTQLWPAWGPSVSYIDSSDRFIIMGSYGRVRTVVGFWLPFAIASYKHLEYWDWKIGDFQATGHKLPPSTNRNAN